MRRVRNSIDCLIKDNGVRVSNDAGISNIVTQYLGNLFMASHTLAMEDVLEGVPSRVTEKMNNVFLCPLQRAGSG